MKLDTRVTLKPQCCSGLVGESACSLVSLSHASFIRPHVAQPVLTHRTSGSSSSLRKRGTAGEQHIQQNCQVDCLDRNPRALSACKRATVEFHQWVWVKIHPSGIAPQVRSILFSHRSFQQPVVSQKEGSLERMDMEVTPRSI